jgi:galactokinase
MALIPGAWYTFITMAFISNVPIGFGLSYNVSMLIGVVLALLYSVVVWKKGTQLRDSKTQVEAPPTY